MRGLLALCLLAISLPVYAQVEQPIPDPPPNPFYHLPWTVQDFMCGMATYGTAVDELGVQAVSTKIEATLDRAEILYHPVRHFFRRLFPFLHIRSAYSSPYVSFDIPADLDVAGYYDEQSDRLNFNPVYLNKFTWEYVENVVVHEVAHKVDYTENGLQKDSHGPTWKLVVYELGGNNNATYHNYTFCTEQQRNLEFNTN